MLESPVVSRILLVCSVGFFLAASAHAQDPEPEALWDPSAALLEAARTHAPVDFTTDVQPILSGNCLACHGPDAAHRAADLRLDTRDGLFAPRDGFPGVVVPGQIAASALLERVFAEDPDDVMPPPSAEHQLTAAERTTLLAWVHQGAPFQGHWAFEAMKEPTLPRPRAAEEARGLLDLFVLAGLEKAGLGLSPEADRRTLIRRLSLDLTGLPPTPDEVRAFVEDPAKDAYERLVDRLLASPRFGEHLARPWLDAARYGDTHGLHLDNYREMWPYRDWVVRAMNEDLPYDRFLVMQLAGDLLPDPQLDDLVATGFLRSHVSTNEGGSIELEVMTRNVMDRVDTVGSVFLGLTVGCAACHDHKFDPLSQSEYYSLFAFFNNLDGKPMDGNARVHAPVVRVPSPEQKKRRAELAARIRDGEEQVRLALAAMPWPEEPALPEREEERDVVWVDDALPEGASPEGSPLLWLEGRGEAVHSGRLALTASATGFEQRLFRKADRKLRVGAGDRFFAHVRIDPKDPPKQLLLQWNADGDKDWEHRAFWGENLVNWGKAGTPSRHAMGPLPESGTWVRLEVPAAAVGFVPGSVVHGLAWGHHGGTVSWDGFGIVTATEQEPVEEVLLDDAVPEGAELGGEQPRFQFVEGAEVVPFSGQKSLRRGGREGLHQDWLKLADGPVLVAGDRLFAHVWLDPSDPPKGIQLQIHSGNWEHRIRWGVPAHGAGARGFGDVDAGPLPDSGRWIRLEVPSERVGLKPGERVEGMAFTQVGGTVHWDRAGLQTWRGEDLSRLSFDTWASGAVADASLPADVHEDLLAGGERRIARWHWMRNLHPGSRERLAPIEAPLARHREALARLEAMIPTTLVMREREEVRPSHRLDRGAYDQPREVVARTTPAALPAWPEDAPRDRLGLARWMLADEHPLTLRVHVNRIWQHVFGRGLVSTSEDFGRQGMPPTHPELLDWLALRFREDGYSNKQLIRRLVTSATYRQVSHVDEDLLARDPDNRWHARAPRHRLDGEVLRDQALAISGLLVHRLGGPGVRPPQPKGLWKAVGYVGSNTQEFRADTGAEKVWRRSLYTFWKRTAPPPQFSTFDAPTREACVMRRERTNTPLQALLLMNDPQFLEAARAFADRLLAGPAADADRIDRAFEIALARKATATERQAVLELLHAERPRFEKDEESVRALLGIGEAPVRAGNRAELAAWTMVASLVLNLDQTLSRE